jgi:hypothetical protein
MTTSMVIGGQVHQHRSQPLQQIDGPAGFVAQVHAHVQGHLVVAAAGGVQLLRHLSRHLQQPASMCMWMSSRLSSKANSPRSSSRLMVPSPSTSWLASSSVMTPTVGQHLAVGDAAGDVVGVKPPVIGDGGGKGLHACRFSPKTVRPRVFQP